MQAARSLAPSGCLRSARGRRRVRRGVRHDGRLLLVGALIAAYRLRGDSSRRTTTAKRGDVRRERAFQAAASSTAAPRLDRAACGWFGRDHRTERAGRCAAGARLRPRPRLALSASSLATCPRRSAGRPASARSRRRPPRQDGLVSTASQPAGQPIASMFVELTAVSAMIVRRRSLFAPQCRTTL